MKDGNGSFWTTVPGILTGIAALISAAVAAYVALRPESPGKGRDQEPGIIAPAPGPPVKPPVSEARGFRITEAILRADPFEHQGRCPVTIRFTGRISAVGGSGTVSYRFPSSDGASDPVKTLTFAGPGSQDVETTWQLGSDFSGWRQIEILDPVETTSNRAEFTIRCR